MDADTFRAFTYRFIQDDVEWAREHGYGERLRQAFFKTKKRDRNLSYQKGLTPTERDRSTAALQGGRDTPILTGLVAPTRRSRISIQPRAPSGRF